MSEKADAVQITTIVQDPNFIRVVADAGLVFFLGRDVELATLAVSPNVNHPQTFEDLPAPTGAPMGRSAVTLSNEFVETARVRMSPAAASAVAMNLLQTLLDNGHLDESQLREQIDAMITMSSTPEAIN